MKRSLALWCAPLLIAGCRNAPQITDPFLPRTTVPPPGTGAAAGAAAPDYYPGPAATSPTAAPAGGLYTPPGGSYNSAPADAPTAAPYQGGGSQPVDNFRMTRGAAANEHSANSPRSRGSHSAAPSQLASAAGGKSSAERQESAVRQAGGDIEAADSGRVVQTSHVKIVRVIEPETAENRETSWPPPTANSEKRQDAAASEEPRRLAAADDAVDIMDLPPARSKTPGSRVAQRVASGSANPGAADRYGYSSDYHTLRGQLEYSLAERRWKLRYIPIDGDTDSHGGSVVLVDNPPDEFQAGDFVKVQGDLTGDTAVGEFAPKYQASKIAPLAD
ncbi:MAG TPA: hypothetical protein VN699_08315 [Pirellulales bacterium]|nr:hypothetical protein [Pirellulales bacterium]